MANSVNAPTYDKFMNPIIHALIELGGSATIDELDNRVIQTSKLTPEQIELPHKEGSTQTQVEYRLAWARTYLKKAGILENSARGVWALTPYGREQGGVDPKEIVKYVRSLGSSKQSATTQSAATSEAELEADVNAEVGEESWRSQLLRYLKEEMKPDAFERLARRILLESGFIRVEVTGKSGDGGIDGRGILQLGGLINFRVLFQCKRYADTVEPKHIREFQAVVQGRAERGLFITTGRFTSAATSEATRDGAIPIDLIDGRELLSRLKQLGLGVKTEVLQVEKVSVDLAFFEGI